MLKGSRNHDSGKGAPSAELGIAKQDLAPRVKSHLDNFRAQITRILEKYGVSTLEELHALGEANIEKINLKDINRLQALTGKIEHIVETGEGQFGELEAEVSLKDYSSVESAKTVGDRMAFKVKKGKKKFIVTEDGTEIGKEYDNVDSLSEVNGKIVFAAKKDREWIVVTEDGREIGKGEGYKNVHHITEVNGKIVFRANEHDSWLVITEEGREVLRTWADLSNIRDLVSVGDEIVYSMSKKERDSSLTRVIGKKWSIWREGVEQIGSKYDNVYLPTDVGGKVAFKAEQGDSKFIATEDGREIGRDKNYDNVGAPVGVAGKIAFKANKGEAWFIATEDGREVGTEYDIVNSPKDVGGKIVFIAFKDEKWFVATEDGVEVGKEYGYSEIINFYEVDSTHVAVVAKQGDKYVRHIHEISAG